MFNKLLHASFTVGVVLSLSTYLSAAILFESGTLGETGISREDVHNQVVLGANLNSNAFNGVRFELVQPAVIAQVGGHFVGSPNNDAMLFAAIIELDNESDFPDSADLSTPDVLGNAILNFPEPSDKVVGDLELSLDPGWYALVFGSGLFGTGGDGAALLNNSDVGTQSYIGYLSGFGWGTRQPGMYFVITGTIIPEPSCFVLILLGTAALFCPGQILTYRI
jgi:hypothetical protein